MLSACIAIRCASLSVASPPLSSARLLIRNDKSVINRPRPLYIVPLLCYTPATDHPHVLFAAKASLHGHATYSAIHLTSAVWWICTGGGDIGMDRWNRAAVCRDVVARAALGMAARWHACRHHHRIHSLPSEIVAWRRYRSSRADF